VADGRSPHHLREAARRVLPVPDISDVLEPDGFRTSAEFAEALLAEAHVALTAGEGSTRPASSASRTRPRWNGCAKASTRIHDSS
jgi:hypothetical protein